MQFVDSKFWRKLASMKPASTRKQKPASLASLKPLASSPALRRGVACVELAILLPLFLALFAGVVDYGRYLRATSVAAVSAREGARQGGTIAASETLAASGFGGSVAETLAGDKYTVSVSIPLQNCLVLRGVVARGEASFPKITLRKNQ